MPVSPTQKQDLMLIKNAFEQKALAKTNTGALWLPMVTTVQQSRRIHEVIRDEVEKYPTATYKNQQSSDDQSFLKQAQIECIPCLGRIKSIGELDLDTDLFSTLMAYNGRALENLINLFKSVSRPNRIQEALCESYIALRSQCVPDIARLITQLKLLMDYLRSFNLKSLKDQLISLVGALIVRTMVFSAINYDMYVTAITDVTRCIAQDINTQLTKLEPILSREGLEDIATLLPLDTQDGELSRKEAAEEKVSNWFPGQEDFNYAQSASNKITGAQAGLENKLNSFTNFEEITSVGVLIKDMIEESISVVDNKFQDATSELLKFLKLSDGNMRDQVQLIDQIQLIRSVLEVLQTIFDTRGDFDPCGKESGRRFFDEIDVGGPFFVVDVDDSDPENPEVTIVPPTVRIDNPVVEEILNENGIETGPIKNGRVVKSTPISINVSRCIDGKQ